MAARSPRHGTSSFSTTCASQRDRPGAKTRYRKLTRTHQHLHWRVDEQQVAHDAASDGSWRLFTNDRTMTGATVQDSYKWQPNLEKRHAQLKGTQLVAPLFLRDPTRIEGLLCTHFIAMLLQALVERTIRSAKRDRGREQLSIYPEDRGCNAPTSALILDIFTGIARHHLKDPTGTTLKTFQPALNDLQRQVLDLLDIPETVYNEAPSLGDG